MSIFRKILTFCGYVSLTLTVLVATFLLVAYGRGYGFDLKTHRLTLNGLLIASSTPGNAKIEISGHGSHDLPYRATLEVGKYQLNVTQAGYQPWEKIITAVASQVTWAQYIFLFPLDLTPHVVVTNPSMTGLTASVDHRHFAYLTTGDGAAVWTFDPGNNQTTKLYSAAAATSTTPAETLQSVTWSNDASHLLITSDNGGKTAYKILPAGGGTPIDLSGTFPENFASLQFSPGNWQQLYFLEGQNLRRVDVNAKTVSGILADNVSSFSFGANRVFYVQTTPLGKSLVALDSTGRAQTIVDSLPDSPAYTITYASYQGQDELAVLPSAAHSITLYSSLFSNNPKSQLVTKSAVHLSFNGDGRFLAFWSGNSADTYDLEQSAQAGQPVIYSYKLATPIDNMDWFDTYHLLAVSQGKVSVNEYDGANAVAIGQTLPSQMAFQSQDQKLIVLLNATADGKTQLATITVKK